MGKPFFLPLVFLRHVFGSGLGEKGSGAGYGLHKKFLDHGDQTIFSQRITNSKATTC